jgi:hypothetical protein
MGPSDLLFVHLGKTDRQFFSEVQPLMVESGADPLFASYPPFFAAMRILKFRSYQEFPNLNLPGNMELRELAAAAQGTLSFDESQENEWRDDGLILGVEDITLRTGQIEAYMTFALSLPLDVHGRVTEMLVHKLLYAVVLPDPRVFSVYEGWGSVRTVQFVIRTRCTPIELYDFIEHIHAQSESMELQAHTATHVVIDCKTFRLYDNLHHVAD